MLNSGFNSILQKGKLDILARLVSRRFGTITPEIQQQLTSLFANQHHSNHPVL
ncbi:MAG: DUF4351 domain-containing protein [Hassallia sp. WJT32-NPBG1]|jgi:hypothetical protein|nr:DUF4351 domain-containing protein [Hassallia sp. WJT32-NPBG1]